MCNLPSLAHVHYPLNRMDTSTKYIAKKESLGKSLGRSFEVVCNDRSRTQKTGEFLSIHISTRADFHITILTLPSPHTLKHSEKQNFIDRSWKYTSFLLEPSNISKASMWIYIDLRFNFV